MNHKEIMREQTLCLEKLYDFNATRSSEGEKRAEMLRKVNEHDKEYYFKDKRIAETWK